MDNSVIELSRPALRYAVEICELHPNYLVGVVVSEHAKEDKAMDILTDYVDCVQLERLCDSSIGKHISFKNGSRIYVIVANDCSRGHRWNALILDEDIDNKVYRNILRHCNTRPYPVNQ